MKCNSHGETLAEGLGRTISSYSACVIISYGDTYSSCLHLQELAKGRWKEIGSFVCQILLGLLSAASNRNLTEVA